MAAVDRSQRQWNDELPRPPAEVYALLEVAREHGLWLRWARHRYHQQLDGGRYRLTRPGSLVPVLTTDDLDAVRDWLAGQ